MVKDIKWYHYSTWEGRLIHESKIVKPSYRYSLWEPYGLAAGCCAEINTEFVFLTSNGYWEPSIQASSEEGYWEKCGSCPEVYTELGIPCWRFEVYATYPKLVWGKQHERLFRAMLQDAINLGSKISEWCITDIKCKVLKTYKWEDGKWRLKK